MKNKKIYLLAAFALMLGACLWLTGCESDTVAPHDELPQLTDEDKAYQAAAMGAAAGRVLPQIVEFDGTSKNEYTYSFPADGSDLTGNIYFDFRMGNADGAPAAFDAASWGNMFTAANEPIVFAVGVGGTVEVDFNIVASLVQATNTATLLEGSQGTFTAGDYSATFAFDGVIVTAGADYPAGGTMTFTSGGTVLIVTFDGDNTATISLNGIITWILNLDDGSITEIG